MQFGEEEDDEDDEDAEEPGTRWGSEFRHSQPSDHSDLAVPHAGLQVHAGWGAWYLPCSRLNDWIVMQVSQQ